MKNYLLRTFAAAVLVILSGGAHAEMESRDHYSAGIEHARAADFASARDHFNAAQRQGAKDPTLAYNLGVVNFRLGDIEAARQSFSELLEEPGWRALAHYNLGLIEEAAGREAAARGHFGRTRALARQPKLKAMAEHKLEIGRAEAPSPANRQWHGLVSLGGGYDDNVILADDRLIDTVSNQADDFAEYLAAARRRLSGDQTQGLKLDLSSYYRAHAELDGFDFGAFTASLLWERPAGDWMLSTGLRGDAQFAGGDGYANALTHRLVLERGSDTRLQVRNDLSYLSGQSRFDYVSGWRNRTRLQVEAPLPVGRTRLAYEIEFNDRDDLVRDPEFFSYSPRRQKLSASVRFEATRSLIFEAQGDYRWSTYQDHNRFFDSTGGLIDAPRDQDGVTLSLRASFRMSTWWYLWGQLQHIESNSSIVRYQYTNNRYLVGLERLF